MRPSRGECGLLLSGALTVLGWSGIHPHDRLTGWMEVAPVRIAVPLLLATGPAR